jgi:ribosomal 50S subunit-associated protein YjgA (DUF615 family)
MKAPSAMRSFYEDKIMENHSTKGMSRSKHSRNAVHIIQLCKEVETILDHKLLKDLDLTEQLRRLLNYDPRAKLDIGQH